MEYANSRTDSGGNSQSELMPTKLSRARMRPKTSAGDAAAAQRIPGVHGAQDGQVGIGVETVDESAALVVEVAGDIEPAADQPAALVIQAPGVFAVAVGIAPKPLVE